MTTPAESISSTSDDAGAACWEHPMRARIDVAGPTAPTLRRILTNPMPPTFESTDQLNIE